MFLLFCFDDYYPYGGWQDFVGKFDSIEDALDAAIKARRDNYQIVSVSDLKVIKQGGRLYK